MISLSRRDAAEIADVLSDAFAEDPAFVALFRGLDKCGARSYRTFMQLWTRSAFHLGHSLYGVRTEGTLAGVVGVSHGTPKAIVGPIAELVHVPALLWGMRLSVGLSLARAVRRPAVVAKSAAEISMLAVRPSMQGRGIAAALLSTAHGALRVNEYNGPVYLYTTAQGSKTFYEKQGYKLVLATSAASVDVFHMLFAPDSGPNVHYGQEGQNAPH